MDIKNILSTKVLREHIIKAAYAKNVHIDCCSFLNIQPSISNEVSNHIATIEKENITAVFTSENTVMQLETILTVFPKWKIICINGATAEAIKKGKLSESNIIFSAKEALKLGEFIIKERVNNIHFFCGKKRLNYLPQLFKKNNIKHKEYLLYDTISTPVKVKDSYEGYCFYSPSGINSFIQVNNIAKGKVIFVIGNTTANRAKEVFGNQEIIICEQPTQQNMLDKITNYYYGK